MEQLQTECAVSGGMSNVLHVSSVIGSAPLKFERARDGWKITVSDAVNVYGIIYVMALCVIASVSLGAGLVMYPRSFHAYNWLDDVVAVVHLAITLAVALAGALTAAHRMRHMVHNLALIQQIDLEINQYCKQEKPGDTRSFMIMVIYYYAPVLINVGLFVYEVVIDYDFAVWVTWDVLLHLLVAYMHSVIFQFHLLAVAVLASFKRLNVCLTSLVNKLLDDCSMAHHTAAAAAAAAGAAAAAERTSATLHRLAVLYGTLCDVMRAVQDSYGLVLVQITITSLLCCASSSYHACRIAFSVAARPSELYKALPDFMWVWLYAGNVKCLCDPCQFTYVEMNLTKRVIAKLLRHASRSRRGFNEELQLFYRQIALNDVTYSPLGMFTLGSKFINTMLGIVTGLTVILLELV